MPDFSTLAKRADSDQALVLGILVVCFTYVFTVYLVAMKARIGTFRRRFMRDFDELHTKAFPESDKSPEVGYPDCGSGWFSRSLPYELWYKMNNGQRC